MFYLAPVLFIRTFLWKWFTIQKDNNSSQYPVNNNDGRNMKKTCCQDGSMEQQMELVSNLRPILLFGTCLINRVLSGTYEHLQGKKGEKKNSEGIKEQ